MGSKKIERKREFAERNERKKYQGKNNFQKERKKERKNML